MKIPLLPLAVVALAAIALADTITDQEFGPAGNGDNTLTIEAPKGETVKIPDESSITVLDAGGNPAKPRPSLRISPTLGEMAVKYTITVRDGTFPNGGSVVIGELVVSGEGDPTGRFGLVRP